MLQVAMSASATSKKVPFPSVRGRPSRAESCSWRSTSLASTKNWKWNFVHLFIIYKLKVVLHDFLTVNIKVDTAVVESAIPVDFAGHLQAILGKVNIVEGEGDQVLWEKKLVF